MNQNNYVHEGAPDRKAGGKLSTPKGALKKSDTLVLKLLYTFYSLAIRENREDFERIIKNKIYGNTTRTC